MKKLRQTGQLVLAKLLSLVTIGATTLQQSGTNSVAKVIDMLQDMSASAKKSKQEEEVSFAKFSSWCSLEQQTLAKEVKQGISKMERVSAQIGKFQSSAKALGAAVADLQSNVEKGKADMTAEKNQREKDHKAFLAESTDYAQSVDALERAITALQKQNYDRPALLQLTEADQLPAKARAIITILVGGMDGKGSTAESDLAFGTAPEANAYEFQSEGIIDQLTKLQDDFSSKLDACQKEEANSKHAFDMIMADLGASVKNAEREIQEKIVTKERKLEAVAINKKELSATSQVNKESKATLATVTAECREKALSFEEKQNLRVEEIDAIEQAVEILSSPEVSGNAQKHFDMMQVAPATAVTLMQVSGRGGWPEGMRKKVRDFLVTEGRRLHSQHLILLSQQASADPFVKVKGMIDAMITRLQEQAQADAAHEGFCDTEMGKSKITRTKLSEDIDGLSASVESGKAHIASLKEDVASLTKEVATLVQSIKEAAAFRSTEKSTNSATVKDAEAAQAAIQSAVAVLKTFYEKASTATALLQSQAPQARKWGLKKAVKFGSDEWKALAAPGSAQVDTGHKEGMQTFGDAYTGQQDEAEYGVLGLLAVVQSDFANLEADTKAAEASSQRAYEEFMSESMKNKAVKERTIEMANADNAAAEENLQKDKAELKTRQDELLAADRYHARLVPQCVDQGMTFKERTEARAAEVESLKEALEMLSGDAAAA